MLFKPPTIALKANAAAIATAADLNVLTREIADQDTELKAYNNDKLNNEMKAFREKNEQAFGKKKSMWDAMKGTLNCMIGKS